MSESKPNDLQALGEGSVGSLVTDHVFVSRLGEWWDRCACGLAESAHEATENPPPYMDALVPAYRCPRCVVADREVCTHSPEQITEWLEASR